MQFHASILRALSDIAIIASPLNDQKEPNKQLKIQYHVMIGTVEEASLPDKIEGPLRYRTSPAYPSHIGSQLEHY